MSELVTTEFVLFLYAAYFGIEIAFAYDLLRIFRRVVGHNRLAMAFEDFLYWLWAGVKAFLMLYEYHNGHLRFYTILGVCTGIFLYTVSIGAFFVKYSAKLLNKTKSGAFRAAEKAGKRAEGVLEKPRRAAASKLYALKVLLGRKGRLFYRTVKKKLTVFRKMIKIILLKH
jgi:Spore cortex protein YabQ (Spore_YabQ).